MPYDVTPGEPHRPSKEAAHVCLAGLSGPSRAPARARSRGPSEQQRARRAVGAHPPERGGASASLGQSRHIRGWGFASSLSRACLSPGGRAEVPPSPVCLGITESPSGAVERAPAFPGPTSTALLLPPPPRRPAARCRDLRRPCASPPAPARAWGACHLTSRTAHARFTALGRGGCPGAPLAAPSFFVACV
jgi:hypothetical protein